MRSSFVFFALGAAFTFTACSAPNDTSGKIPTFQKITLSEKFLSEGVTAGDFNRDGTLDVAAGPFWYEGPDFVKRHEIHPPTEFDPKNYSDNFTAFTLDLNADGWDDIFVCPHPGTRGYWFENPRNGAGHWKKHLMEATDGGELIGNESPHLVRFTTAKGAKTALVYNIDGYLGYATLTVEGAVPRWDFQRVSGHNPRRYERYTHGVGAGDINGDGLTDLLENEGWWEQPAEASAAPWRFHKYKFAAAGAHIRVLDVDGDGLPDVLTPWHAHLYGLVWHRQQRDSAGAITWERREILPIKPDLQSAALRISQMHANTLADFNGDGTPDFLTGKRYFAHGPDGDAEPHAAPVLYWFELRRDAATGVTFIPHKIDDASGVSTQVNTADLNGDGTPDILVSSKKGTFVFLSRK